MWTSPSWLENNSTTTWQTGWPINHCDGQHWTLVYQMVHLPLIGTCLCHFRMGGLLLQAINWEWINVTLKWTIRDNQAQWSSSYHYLCSTFHRERIDSVELAAHKPNFKLGGIQQKKTRQIAIQTITYRSIIWSLSFSLFFLFRSWFLWLQLVWTHPRV